MLNNKKLEASKFSCDVCGYDSGSAHTRPSSRPPIDTSENFPAHMSASPSLAYEPLN